MIHNIAPNIESLAVDIDMLNPLENNARRGNVEAIMASYQKFGQVKPIVAVEDSDGKLLVIAGNHQLEAATQLGWEQIAVSIVDLSADDALAFSLADNRISDLGATDNEALFQAISEVAGTDVDFFETLGWDDFSVAVIENEVIENEIYREPRDPNAGWSAPEIIISESSTEITDDERDEEGPALPPRPTEVPTSTIVTQGSTTTSASGTTNASIQFTLVFDSAIQQSEWYSFLRWLKDDSTYEGETTAERLLSFIATHRPKE
tara:strand:+ start:792 stop:1580 length:789 start_codon:yes stop_codon:yes gene_type:complete